MSVALPPETENRSRLSRVVRFTTVLVAVWIVLEILARWALSSIGLPSRIRFDPVLGHVFRSDLDVSYRGVRVRTEGDGLVASPIDRPRSDPETTRTGILVVGDSFPAGEGVDWPHGAVEIAAVRLQTRGIPVHLVNASVPGYGTDQALLRARQLLEPWHRLLVYLLYENDLTDNQLAFQHDRTRPRFEVDSAGIRQVDRPSSADRWTDWSVAGKVLARWRTRRSITRPPRDSGVELTAALVAAMREAAASNGTELLILAHHGIRRPASERFSELVSTRALSGAIVLNDVLPLRDVDRPDGFHWDRTGHRLVGELLATEIVRRFEEPTPPGD